MKSTNQDYEFSILVGHKPIHEYYHEGATFIEGRNGSEYKIRIRNNSYRRACFVVSVDGLSVLNGKDAADDSPGYVLNAHEALDIVGYKVDDATGAKFVFGTKEQSYAVDIGKGKDNTGVIAVKVFAEKYVPSMNIAYAKTPKWRSPKSFSTSAQASTARHSGGWGFNTSFGMASSNSAESLGSLSSNIGCLNSSDANLLYNQTGSAEEIGLGTVFGEATEMRTQQVAFQREALAAAQMVIFYDTRKGLEYRGVRLDRKASKLPNPFPGNNGCPVPRHWRK